ncbi:alpha/beta hydrolase [bacterium]|nr:alpha/beta hydrolase [bacterium]
MIFRYTEAPSFNSLVYEKMLWAAKVKDSQEPKPANFKVRDYSRGIRSPAPPEHLGRRFHVSRFEVAGRYAHEIAPKPGPALPATFAANILKGASLIGAASGTAPDLDPCDPDTVSAIEEPSCPDVAEDFGGSPTVLFLHGGSYVVNATHPHWRFLAKLVEKTGCRVVAPDYPLAPEHCYADAYRMLRRLYLTLLERQPRPKIVLMGDSAGGGLALGFAMYLRDEGLPPPETLVLLSPWLDITMSNPRIAAIDREDPFLNREALVVAGESWARGANPRKPLLSPLYGAFDDLPTMHLFIGTKDILAADCRRFRDACQEKGARLAYYEFEHMVHDWMLLDFKEAKIAMAQVAAIVAGVAAANEEAERDAPVRPALDLSPMEAHP